MVDAKQSRQEQFLYMNVVQSLYQQIWTSQGLKLTHLRKYRIYVSLKWVSIGSDNGLSPIRRQAII